MLPSADQVPGCQHFTEQAYAKQRILMFSAEAMCTPTTLKLCVRITLMLATLMLISE